MKHLTAFLMFLLLTLPAISQTSVYHPFPDSNVVWNVESSSPCSVGVSDRFWMSYIIQGDTIIGANNYHKIFLAWMIEHWTCFGLNFSSPGYYNGAIRQDTVARSVYFVDRFDSTERILYDFNLNVGDTIRGYLMSNGCPTDSIIREVDSVFINGNYRKRWRVDLFYGPNYIIEGIGFTGGPFIPVCSWFEGGAVLVCCTQDNVVLFQDSLYTSTPDLCELLDAVKEDVTASNVSLIPNPMHSVAVLNTNIHSGKLLIYDCYGKKVRESEIESENILLEREDLKDGIYFFQLTAPNSFYTSGKFIIE
jgi:hypothetical protein